MEERVKKLATKYGNLVLQGKSDLRLDREYKKLKLKLQANQEEFEKSTDIMRPLAYTNRNEKDKKAVERFERIIEKYK